jgi:hypothetical protein
MDAFQLQADGREHLVHFRRRIGSARSPARLSGKVEQQHVHAAPPEPHANRERGVRAQGNRARRLADLAAQGFHAHDHAFPEQPVDDHRHRLGAQVGQARQVCLGQAAMQADGLQQHSLVVFAHADLVRSERARRCAGAAGSIR